MRYDGKEKLRQVLFDARYPSLEAAVAKHALFLHPDTVRQTENRNLFRIVRDESSKRGQIVPYAFGSGKVLLDDNNGPASAFEWAISGFSRVDGQLNHIYSDSRNVETYTSMANLCITPSFLAKLTDTDKGIKALLQYRAYDLYGFVPQGRSAPEKPEGYAKLEWHPFPSSVATLEKTFRQHMATKPKCRTTISASKIGWLFSGFEPDHSLPSAG